MSTPPPTQVPVMDLTEEEEKKSAVKPDVEDKTGVDMPDEETVVSFVTALDKLRTSLEAGTALTKEQSLCLLEACEGFAGAVNTLRLVMDELQVPTKKKRERDAEDDTEDAKKAKTEEASQQA